MADLPNIQGVLSVYEDQVEALAHLYRSRTSIVTNSSSRFFDLLVSEVQMRLERDRDELDAWASMMLLAEFEATLRRDMETRLRRRTKDRVRRNMKELEEASDGRVRFEALLGIWDKEAFIKSALKQEVRRLVKHRHWLAHGRYWNSKYGTLPAPPAIYSTLLEYTDNLKSCASDFPLS